MKKSICSILCLTLFLIVQLDAQQGKASYTKYGISDQSIAQLRALEVGESAPDFKASDQNNKKINLNKLTEEHNVILIFYRGNWCPYCTRYLAEFNDRLDEIKAKNTVIIAVSPESNSNLQKTAELTSSDIHFISDNDNTIMDAYNVRFNVNDQYQEKFTNWTKGKTLGDMNQQDEATLPVPATYLIGKGGKIKWVHFDPNYSERGDVNALIESI
ncbi:MAG: AhpC/TSA family protein [Saprospiraceae bacterium]|nr:AhpC/TSA family protein [Saprospiraceae bacterium]